jgi:hypothetical protein
MASVLRKFSASPGGRGATGPARADVPPAWRAALRAARRAIASACICRKRRPFCWPTSITIRLMFPATWSAKNWTACGRSGMGEVLRFRSGKTIHAPAWFVAGLPRQPLDGELWIGRGQFERVSGIVRQEVPDDAGWREVRYMIFELPGAPGSFAERAEQIRRLVSRPEVPWLFEIEQFFVADRSQSAKTHLDDVAQGGRRRADAAPGRCAYETGRSDVLLKLKPWQDAEAVVVGHQPGKGRPCRPARGVAGTDAGRAGIPAGNRIFRCAAARRRQPSGRR